MTSVGECGGMERVGRTPCQVILLHDVFVIHRVANVHVGLVRHVGTRLVVRVTGDLRVHKTTAM